MEGFGLWGLIKEYPKKYIFFVILGTFALPLIHELLLVALQNIPDRVYSKQNLPASKQYNSNTSSKDFSTKLSPEFTWPVPSSSGPPADLRWPPPLSCFSLITVTARHTG